VDKQSENAGKKKGVIMLREGSLIVSNRELTLIEYLRKCDYNGSKPDRDRSKDILFLENKPAEKAAAFVDMDRKAVDLAYRIHNMEIGDLEMFALALNIPNPQDKPSEELRRDMLILAKNNPKLFDDGMSDKPKMKIKYNFAKAAQLGIININQNIVSWGSGGVCMQIPIGKDAIEYLVENSYSGDGMMIYEEVMKKLSPKTVEQRIEAEPINPKKGFEQTDSEKLMTLAIDQGVIVRKGPWYKMEGTVSGDAYFSICKNPKELADIIESDQELAKYIKARLD